MNNTDNIQKAIGYGCPICKVAHNDNEDGYTANGKHYPIILNEVQGSTLDGSYHDWHEVHHCETCNVEYWFRNGAF